ncbi:MAG TPA: trypsin-like peptidase domain-containing protein [Bryobacteraceae bacterium]|nr:trypsin-like peptidase domain-containing protein [Bryobacteraceae bacterium]
MRSILLCVSAVVGAAIGADAALVPPIFVHAVVAIGHAQTNSSGTPTWVTEGSAFFYGYLIGNDPDPSKRRYEVYLVTNRHVVQGHKEITVRLNPKQASDRAEEFDVSASDWFTHKDPGVDISCARINWKLLEDRGIDVSFIASDTQAADTGKMKDIGVSAGDGIFVLGFPMNLAGEQRNYVIVRPGAIARITDLIESAAPVLLIDSHVFPGNSGGPVILQPNAFAIEGTKPNPRAYLLGVVKSFIPYVDVAVSPQTQRPRVTFEENSGLAEVVPVDRINEAIKAWREALPASQSVPLKTTPASK